MFYPQAMTEIQLIIPEKDLIAITKVLADYRNFYQVDANYLSEEAVFNASNLWKEREASYATEERRILTIMRSLGIQEALVPPDSSVSMIESEMVLPIIEQIGQEVNRATEQLTDEQKRLEQLNGYLHQVEPIAELDIDISDLEKTRYIYSMLGIMPVANINRLQTSLARIPNVLLILSQDAQKAVVWLAGTQRQADVLERAARSAYLNPLRLPHIHRGTPAEVIASLHTAIERTRQSIAEQKAAVAQLTQAHRQQLQVLLWRVRASRMMAAAIARFGQLQYTYLIVGWVPLSKLEDLKLRLKKASAEIVIDTFAFRRENAEQNIPVVLSNPNFLKPFQQLVTTYARPRYTEIDPTLLIALTFPLLFGAMFGDVGHGLLLSLLGGLLVSRKVRALRGMAGLGGLIVICGLAAMLFGFLYGSLFGSESILPALWMRPMGNITQILMIAIGGGVVLLSIGFILGMLNAGIAHDWSRLFFDHNGLAGFVLYWSLIGLLASSFTNILPVPSLVFLAAAALAGLAVMFSEILERLIEKRRPLIDGGIGTFVVQAVFELFETLISFLSNTLSYVRVGAFAVAHAGLSAVIFILADLVSPGRGFGYWVVVVLGTLFIVGFEGLIVGIQTMRLEYYELFSKFFKGGGIQHKPLEFSTTAEE
jgi:V/A-type H+-transporting ATPase subunit I